MVKTVMASTSTPVIGMERGPHDTALGALLAVLKTPALAAELCGDPALWSEIKRLAEVHRLSGLLAWSVSAALPPAERPWRDSVLMTHHSRHQRFTGQLHSLVMELDNAGVPAVVLKGPVLAERFHPVPFLKLSHDLDILVRMSEIPTVTRLMLASGFRLVGGFPWRIQRNCEHHLNFVAAANGLMVEVHYSFKAGAHLFPSEEFIDRSVNWRSANGLDFRVLAPADEVFYLIVHAAGHAFQRLRWLYDALAAAKTLCAADRERVLSLAREGGLMGHLVAADMACREFFGESLGFDLSGCATPWLWSILKPKHLWTMAQRNDYSFANRTLDVCRMSGSPASALFLCLENGAGKWPAWLYRLRGGRVGPEVLARSLESAGLPKP